MANGLVGHGELCQVMANHIGLNFNWIPVFSTVHINDGSAHLECDGCGFEIFAERMSCEQCSAKRPPCTKCGCKGKGKANLASGGVATEVKVRSAKVGRLKRIRGKEKENPTRIAQGALKNPRGVKVGIRAKGVGSPKVIKKNPCVNSQFIILYYRFGNLDKMESI